MTARGYFAAWGEAKGERNGFQADTGGANRRSKMPRWFSRCLAAFLGCGTLLAAATGEAARRPLPAEQIVVRGNSRHPTVNLSADDVTAARARVQRYDWARTTQERILRAAEPWLQQLDAYWLGFLPPPGACYAYGFSGCPICGSPTGTWVKAHCRWENPGQVRCEKGHVLPDAEHPDSGRGYVAPDGRTHYFAGQFNAWVTEQWTTRALPALAQAYLLTGDERYADRGLLLLDALASIYKESTSGSWDYPSKTPSGRLARPLYQVARTFVTFVDAYDALQGSGAAGKPSLRAGLRRGDNIEKNLLLDGGYYCYARSWLGVLTNGHADYLRGALAVGCLLDVPEYIDAAVNGPFSIKVMLANNLDRDGQYYETSPNYAIHARNLYTTFAGPLANLRNREFPRGLNLYDDARFQAALTLPDLQFQLAGRRPNYGDCEPEPSYAAPPKRLFNTSDYHLAERLYASVTDPATRTDFGQILNFLAADGVNNMRAKYGEEWLLWHAAPPPPAGAQLPAKLQRRLTESWFAGHKGVALLRSHSVGEAALLRYGPSLMHGDPDDLALLYYANGYELSYDIGYGLASTHCQVGWASSTVSHALVTVNEKNQLEDPGSGGSLRGFARLPSVQFTDADSPLSYTSESVRAYRRSLALMDAGYLVDCFHVEGGRQHDYGFGSLGTALTPFGVGAIKTLPGSLAEGYAWGEKIGADGNIIGHPRQPYWNPPPGNGYGFFFNVRQSQSVDQDWGGIWRVNDVKPQGSGIAWDRVLKPNTEHPTTLRLHLVGDKSEAVFADAPGIYPSFPLSSYVLARRKGENLTSTFLAVYEPYDEGKDGPSPRLQAVERIGPKAMSVRRVDGRVDIILFGSHRIPSAYGDIEFTGDFAYFTGNGKNLRAAEVVGGRILRVNGRPLIQGDGVFTATVTAVDADAHTLEVDRDVPASVTGRAAIFSNPAWSRTSGYNILQAEGRRIVLDAASLVLGVGNVRATSDTHVLESEIPHEFSRTMRGKPSLFLNGKTVTGQNGNTTRINAMTGTSPAKISVADQSVLNPGERVRYIDLSPGDQLHVALLQTWSAASGL